MIRVGASSIFWISFFGFWTSIVQANEIVITANDITTVYRKYSKQSEPERLLTEARKKEQGHFMRSFLPSLEASYSREAFRESGFPSAASYGWGAEGRISLFNGGRDYLEEQVREKKTEKAIADLNIKDQEVLLAIRKAFWSVVFNQSLVKTIEKALADNDEILRLADKRIRAGVASNVDRLDFRLNGIRLKQDLQKAKNELRNSENQLRGQLMISDTDKIIIQQEMLDDHQIISNLDTKNSELKRNPTFTAIQAQSEIEWNLARINSRWFLPKLDLYAGYEKPSLRQDSTGGFGLSQWYTGLELKFSLGEVATSIALRQARDIEAKAHLQLKENTYQVNKNSFVALSENIKALHELFHDAESSVKEAEAYVTRILKEYDKGVKNSIDALNATRQAYDARREGLSILRDYKFAISEFYRLTGDESGLN